MYVSTFTELGSFDSKDDDDELSSDVDVFFLLKMDCF